VLNRW